jgi:light-harvesting complex 1 beta chain
VTIARTSGRPPRTLPDGDTLSFVGIFVAGFVLFLALAVVSQLLGLPWRSWLGAEDHRSLVGGVRASVYSLMSHLT